MLYTIVNTGVDFMGYVNEHVNKLEQELRRGTLTIGVLSQLNEPQYGYSLVTRLKEKGIHVEPGTLYPLLRRLEKQNLLNSEWETDSSRPRKYYSISETGKEVFHLLITEWEKIVTNLNNLLENKGGKTDGNG